MVAAAVETFRLNLAAVSSWMNGRATFQGRRIPSCVQLGRLRSQVCRKSLSKKSVLQLGDGSSSHNSVNLTCQQKVCTNSGRANKGTPRTQFFTLFHVNKMRQNFGFAIKAVAAAANHQDIVSRSTQTRNMTSLTTTSLKRFIAQPAELTLKNQ